VNAHLECLELEAVRSVDDDLAVEDASLGKLRFQGLDEFREVAVEWVFVAALDEELIAIAED